MTQAVVATARPRRWRSIVPGVVIAAVVVAAYWPSFGGAFYFDDYPSIVRNGIIRHVWPIDLHALCLQMRPLTDFTLAISYSLSGESVWGYHLFNLVVHVLATLTLFGLVRRLLRGPILGARFASAADWLAAVVALVWGLHPLQTEAVTYIVQRAESLVGLFSLLTLYCVVRISEPRPSGSGPATQTSGESVGPLAYARGSEGSRWRGFWQIAAVVSCAAAMCSKLSAVLLPLAVLACDWALIAGSLRKAIVSRRWLYVGLGATWAVPILLVCTIPAGASAGLGVKAFTPWTYLLTQTGVIAHYLRLAFLPSGLTLDYDWPRTQAIGDVWLPAFLVLTILAGTIVAAFRGWRGSALAGAWFFLTLAPTSSFMPLNDPAAERRMYLPLAAIACATVMGLYALAAKFWPRRSGRLVQAGTVAQANETPAPQVGLAAMATIVAIVLGMLTWQRNVLYQDPAAMWQDVVLRYPDNFRAHDYLGRALVDRGELETAKREFESAIRINSTYSEARIDLGNVFYIQGDSVRAIECYALAIQYWPTSGEAHLSLGNAQLSIGRYREAADSARRALALLETQRQPEELQAKAQTLLGRALIEWGQPTEAQENLARACELDPKSAQPLYWQGKIQEAKGDFDGALQYYWQALAIEPNDFDANLAAGLALARRNRTAEALPFVRKAAELRPSDGSVRYNLGMCLLQNGQGDEGNEQLAECYRISQASPKSIPAQVHFRLGLMLEKSRQTEKAAGAYRRALLVDPRFDPAQKALERVTGGTTKAATSTAPGSVP